MAVLMLEKLQIRLNKGKVIPYRQVGRVDMIITSLL